MNKAIEEYIQKQPRLKKTICLKLRSIIFEIFPEITEEYKWGAIVFGKGIFYIASVRRGVNLGVAITGLSAEEKKLLNGTGKTMRHLKFESLSDIKEDKIKNILHLVNRKVIIQTY